MCGALPSPLSYHKTLPLDMLGGLAKANTWVAKPACDKFSLTPPPSTCLGAWLKANLRVVRPEEIIPNKHEAFRRRC
jgi:hypothetical protein